MLAKIKKNAKRYWLDATVAAMLFAALLADQAGMIPKPELHDEHGRPVEMQKAVINIYVQIALIIVSALISYAMTPKPPQPKPAALEDFDVPTAEEGRPIPVIFGTVWIKGPNCLWYGDLRSTPIKTKGGKK